MAAHLEGKGTSVLDFTGFAQKFGPVLSYIRIADSPQTLNQVRIDDGRADALIGCDLVVSSSAKAARTYCKDQTRAVLNSTEIATADFVRNPDADMQAGRRIQSIRDAVGGNNLSLVAANRLAAEHLGDTIFANVLMLGYAWQRGLLPLSRAAIEKAIDLNGVRVDDNLRAFTLGRLAANDSVLAKAATNAGNTESLPDQITRRGEFLKAYQDDALARRYVALLKKVQAAEMKITSGNELPLTAAVARAYFKTLAYKDEYEVARLFVETPFLANLKKDVAGFRRIRFHLAPPLLAGKPDARGRPRKKEFGAWIIPVFRLLSKMRGLRGTAFDVFGYTEERRMERALIGEFEFAIDAMLPSLNADTIDSVRHIVELFMDIRGYGPVKEHNAARTRERIDRELRQLLATERQAA